jgi:hypothetical protein
MGSRGEEKTRIYPQMSQIDKDKARVKNLKICVICVICG